MTDKEHPPPLPARRRALNRRRFADNYTDTHSPKPHRPQLVTDVETLIGRKHIVQRTTCHIHDPNIITFEFWPRKSGPRKGQRRWVRVRGVNFNRSVSIRRFRDATSAAYAYHATWRRLGLRLMPISSTETSLSLMGAASLTANGARSVTGQQFAVQMRSLGVQVHDEPVEPRYPGEFWWADS